MTRLFQEFNNGDQVYLSVESAVQKGMYFPRFYGKTGIIVGKRGACYEVEIKDMNKKKMLISHPVHLKLVKN